MQNDTSGHDWWHVERVRTLALVIGKKENANLFIVELAALLHDVADWKLNESEEKGKNEIIDILRNNSIDKEKSTHITSIIDGLSFKGAGVETSMDTIEGKVVQDADRLDAIGAIGIARAFAYGGNKKRLMYDPAVLPVFHASFEEYKNSKGPTINHFYEKLLLLKNLMNTDSAKSMAKNRHKFMEKYLNEFNKEISGLS